MKLVINAGPGCGKTYTATKLCKFLKAEGDPRFYDKNPWTEEQREIWEFMAKIGLPDRPKIFYGAYNRDFVPEVKTKVPTKGSHSPKVSTIHGAGYSVLNTKYGFLKLNNNRGVNIVEGITGQSFYKMRDSFAWLSAIKYADKCKDELLEPTPENLEMLRDKYDGLANMQLNSNTPQRVKDIIKASKKVDRKAGITYTDQVWLALWALKSPIYDLGIIDECQDLSPSRLLLVQRMCRNLLFVGDPDQAINAFAGADPESFNKIQDACDEELPLKVSFRNPPNIINQANALMKRRIIPDKHPRVWLKGTKDKKGPETSCTLNEIAARIEGEPDENLIMCRYNAPLIQAAVKLINAEVPCFIYGKSIVTELMNLVKNRKARDLTDLDGKLRKYKEMSGKDAPDYIKEVISDKVDCVLKIINLCDDLDDVEPVMKDLIREKKKGAVALSTIHKAKGKERKHCHMLFPPVESQYAETPTQLQQEQNLHYVALTRTSHSLNRIHRD